MDLTPDRVAAERRWILDRSDRTVPLLNEVRASLGEAFGTTVDPVDEATYRRAVADRFTNGDVAVNMAALVALLRDLSVEDDYPGFVVDEVLGRELAATIAGGRPLSLLAEATFHVADVHHAGESADPAGLDDLDAALAAGFQTRLPGWSWREEDSPFAVAADR